MNTEVIMKHLTQHESRRGMLSKSKSSFFATAVILRKIGYVFVVCTVVMLACWLPSRPALAQDRSEFVVELSRFHVDIAEESATGGDDPYFVVIGFRSRYRTPGSTQTFWSKAVWDDGKHMYLGDDPSKNGLNIPEGEDRFILPEMGRMVIPNVELFTFEDLTRGKLPEIMGALVIAVESDNCADAMMTAGFEEAQAVLQQKLVELVEQGQIEPTNLDAAALTGIRDDLESKAVAAAKDEGNIFEQIACLADKDAIIDHHLFLYSAVEPTIGNFIPRSQDPHISWGALDNQANRIHEFEISAGEGIVFEHKDDHGNVDTKWETTVIVSARPMAPPPLPDCVKSSQTISRLFLPSVRQEAQLQGTLLYTQTQLQTLQYNVQFLTPWNNWTLPKHWPNTDDRATAVGHAIACYDIVALNETLNSDRRDKIFQVMNDSAPACGKPPMIPGGAYFTMAAGPDVPEFKSKTVQDVLNSIVALRNRPAAQQGEPFIGNEVAIISRLPIVETNSHIYSARAHEDSLVAKGVVHARLRSSPSADDYIDVFATHLQSGDDEVKLCQIAELADFMAQHTEPNVPVLLMGDLNLDGASDKQQGTEYVYLRNTLGLLASGQTLEDVGNHLPRGTNHDEDPAKNRTERIDYIWASPTGWLLNKTDVRINEFGGNGWGTLSDHAGVEANLVLQKVTVVPAPARPDLVVDEVQVTPQGVQVTIRNAGNAPVAAGDNFWLDMYINPRTPPTSVNQIWQDMGDAGLAWAVVSSALPMPPGARIVLDLNDPYYSATLSHYPAEIPGGSQIFVQVDSAKKDSGYGGVLEGHEETAQPYNNITSFTLPETLATAGWRSNVSSAAVDTAAETTAKIVQATTPRQVKSNN